MDRIVETGRANNWSKDQYREALDDLVAAESQLLKSGDRALNKNARKWADGRMEEGRNDDLRLGNAGGVPLCLYR